MKAEIYIKLPNEILVQYRNSINSIERAASTSWQCFEIDIKKFELFELKGFVKNLKRQVNIYALVVVGINITTEKFKSSKILKDYLYLKKLFDNKKAKVLFE